MTTPDDRDRRGQAPDATHLDPGETFQDVPPDATRHDPRAASYGNAAFPPPAAADEDIRVRFGAGPESARVWQPTPRPRRRRSRLTPYLSIALSAAIIAAVAWYLLRAQGELAVSAVSVKAPAGVLRCDRKTSSRHVNVIATLTLNGKAGDLSYRWTQSDAGPLAVQHVRVARGDRTRDIPLDWTVTGTGRTRLTATFDLLSPGEGHAAASFTYSCR